jgi:protein-S-isoprenylcysteine O-methyltransferase Ste14
VINYVYPLALSLLFFIDTAFFTFGYLAEAGFLKNKVRSVEMTFLGWAVTLLTYPPFNSVYNQFFPWVANDYADFGAYTAVFRIVIIVLVIIFVWATLALGTRCSNLTNRGIVGRGPYRHIRHPAYASKNAVWWITMLPVLSIGSFVTMLAWSFLYYLRAVTEERHLERDPDYAEYKKHVRYMFIPKVF